jgi:hypothetical protein
MDIKGKISSLVLNKAMNYISGDSETNIPTARLTPSRLRALSLNQKRSTRF